MEIPNEVIIGGISAISVVFGGILTLLGVLWKSKRDKETKQIEAQATIDVAQIEADTSQQLQITEILAARVTVLEANASEQERLVMKLTREVAVAEAKNQLLTAESATLHVDRDRLQKLNEEQQEYILQLHRSIQDEVAEARFALEEVSEPGPTSE
jgi:hypothetical protein